MYCSFPALSGCLLLLPAIHSTIASPVGVEDGDLLPSTVHHQHGEAAHDDAVDLATHSLDKRAGSYFLRILPLGGSITAGWGSSTGNGYRKPLRDQLRKEGWKVNMVGTQVGNTNAPVTGIAMKDNSVEATAGYVVADITKLLQNSLSLVPNVILINAGVNDCAKNIDIAHIGTRMDTLLDTAYIHIPGTTIFLSTLLPSLDASAAACHDAVNAQYRSIVAARSAKGQKILLAEFAPNNGYWYQALGYDYYDSTHPTDAGHAKLAAIWHQAIALAYARGMLTPPAGVSPNTFGDDADTFTSAALPVTPYAKAARVEQTKGRS